MKHRCYTGKTGDSSTLRASHRRCDGLAATGNYKEHFQKHMRIGKQDSLLRSGLPACFLHPNNQILPISKSNSAAIKVHAIMKHLTNF